MASQQPFWMTQSSKQNVTEMIDSKGNLDKDMSKLRSALSFVLMS